MRTRLMLYEAINGSEVKDTAFAMPSSSLVHRELERSPGLRSCTQYWSIPIWSKRGLHDFVRHCMKWKRGQRPVSWTSLCAGCWGFNMEHLMAQVYQIRCAADVRAGRAFRLLRAALGTLQSLYTTVVWGSPYTAPADQSSACLPSTSIPILPVLPLARMWDWPFYLRLMVSNQASQVPGNNWHLVVALPVLLMRQTTKDQAITTPQSLNVPGIKM